MYDVTRSFALGTDHQLHAVMTLDGDRQTYCDAPLAATPTAGPSVPIHDECMMLELTRVANGSRLV